MATLYLNAANKLVGFAPDQPAGPPLTSPPDTDHTFQFDETSNPVLMAVIKNRPDGLLVAKDGTVTLDGSPLRVEADTPDMVVRKRMVTMVEKAKAGQALTAAELQDIVRFMLLRFINR